MPFAMESAATFAYDAERETLLALAPIVQPLALGMGDRDEVRDAALAALGHNFRPAWRLVKRVARGLNADGSRAAMSRRHWMLVRQVKWAMHNVVRCAQGLSALPPQEDLRVFMAAPTFSPRPRAALTRFTRTW